MNRRSFLAASAGAVGGALAVAGCASSGASNSTQGGTGTQRETAGKGEGSTSSTSSIVTEPKKIGIRSYAVGYDTSEIKFSEVMLFDSRDMRGLFSGLFTNVSDKVFETVSFNVNFGMESVVETQPIQQSRVSASYVEPGATFEFRVPYNWGLDSDEYKTIALIWDVDTVMDT